MEAATTTFDIMFDIPFDELEHESLIDEFLSHMMHYGAKPETIKEVVMTLREGITIAVTRGPRNAINAIVNDVCID